MTIVGVSSHQLSYLPAQNKFRSPTTEPITLNLHLIVFAVYAGTCRGTDQHDKLQASQILFSCIHLFLATKHVRVPMNGNFQSFEEAFVAG
jgi:hypothetical protein